MKSGLVGRLTVAAMALLMPSVVVAGPQFNWSSSDALILPKPDSTHESVAVKDPTVVYANGNYHVFMTTASKAGWHMAYTTFRDWSEARAAPVTYFDRSPIGPGYRAAPQVFYFEPH